MLLFHALLLLHVDDQELLLSSDITEKQQAQFLLP